MAKSTQGSVSSDAAQRTAAIAFAYTLVLALATKLTRAALLADSTHSARPWIVMPQVLGQDLLFAAVVGLIAYAVGRIRVPAVRIGIALLFFTLFVLIHIFDVGAHELIGSPLTFQRLRGEEGGTIGDLGLVGRRELVSGVGSIVFLLGLIWPIARFAPRWAFLRRVTQPRVLVAIILVALGVSYVQAQYGRRTLGLESQSVVTLVASVFDDDAYEGHALSKAEWKKLLTPDTKPKKPETPPPPLPSTRPKNVVVFLAEGIPFEHTGFSGQDKPNPTPRLQARFQRDGFLFSRYYAHWHASNQAIFSLACASLPPLSGDMMKLKPRIDCGEFSQVMHDHGMHAGLFHGGHFTFYNKLALLGRRNYEIELDAEELLRRDPKWQRTRWGVDDRAMVDSTLQWVDSLGKGERFAALLISIAPHYPFEVPKSWTDKPFRGGGELPRYLNGVNYIDATFDRLIKGFEARGLADDTLFVFLGDHGIQVAEPVRETPGRRTFYEPSLHVPMVLFNPKLFPPGMKNRISDRIGGHMDLVPTLLDILGDEPDPRHHGRSLVRNDEWPRRLFYSGEGGRYIGFVDNDHKYTFTPGKKKSEYYDLTSDPDELHDLSDDDPQLMKRYSKVALSIAKGLRAEIAAAPVLDEKVTVAQVYSLFRKNAVVTLEHEGKTVACTANAVGDNSACPGMGDVFRQLDQNIQGEKRRCLRVRVPEGTTIRMRVKDPVTLSLLNGTIAVVASTDPMATLFKVNTDVDGKVKSEILVRNNFIQFVDTPRPQSYLEYAVSRTHKGAPDELCLQLNKLQK